MAEASSGAPSGSLSPAAPRRVQPGHRGKNTIGKTNGQAVQVGSDTFRRVAVMGCGGVRATFKVVVRQGRVWVSVVPYFVGEAILEPEKVDQVIRVLVEAREEVGRRKYN